MKGFEYFESRLAPSKRKNFLRVFFLLVWLFLALGIAISYFQNLVISILMILVIAFIVLFLIFRFSLSYKFRSQQKALAKKYSIKSFPYDSLKSEEDFVLEDNELRVKYYPSVWYSTVKHHLANPFFVESFDFPNVVRSSVLITNKRIIFRDDDNDISVWFLNEGQNNSSQHRFVFWSIDRGNVLLEPGLETESLVMHYVDSAPVEAKKGTMFAEKSLAVFIKFFPYDIKDFESAIANAKQGLFAKN